jgi:tRNA (cmo5U34)-methyltransferase
MAGHDTLCGWGDKGKVAYFLENADLIVPRRQEQINLLVDLMPWPRDTNIAVLDLGAGFGAITDEILTNFPRAIATCVDGSEEMITLARERLEKYGDRTRVLLADLASASWRAGVGGPFDAVVSAIAIHHLSDDRKRELYREVFDLLRPGGLFLNDDLVTTPPALKSRFESLGLRAIQEQDRAKRGVTRPLEEIQAEMRGRLRPRGGQHHSHIAPLRDQLRWLAEAGFTSVDCYWKYLDLAIFGGVKE